MSVKRSKQRNIVTVEDPCPGCDAIVPDTSRMNKPWPSMKIRKMIEDEKAFNALIDREDEEFARKTGRTNYSSYKRNGKKEIVNNKIDIEVLHSFLSTHESEDVAVEELRIDFIHAADTAMPKKQSLLAIVKKMLVGINDWVAQRAQKFSRKFNRTNDDINYKRIDREEIGSTTATCSNCVERFKSTNYYAW